MGRAILLYLLVVASAAGCVWMVTAIDERDEPLGPPIPRQLTGVNIHPLWDGVTEEQQDELIDQAVDSGSNVVRIDMGWSSLQLNGPGEFESGYAERADHFIDAARERGLRVIVTLLETPCWASSAPESRKQGCRGSWWERDVQRYAPNDPEDYANAARMVAQRWGPQLDALEVWNEPNMEFFWRSEDPAGDYGKLLRVAYDAIKEERPALPVLGGSLLFSDTRFLDGMFARGEVLGHYDAIAIHPYTVGDDPFGPREDGQALKHTFMPGLEAVRRVMERAGDPSPELWLTELGASTCPKRLDPDCVDEDGQADYARDVLAQVRELDWVKAAVWYSLVDDGDDAEDAINFFGLITRDGRERPALASFRDAAKATARATILEGP